MNSKDYVLDIQYQQGRRDAEDLRAQAPGMTDTEIIDREAAIPDWSADRDYSSTSVGAPIQDDGQVYGLIQPHNAAHYPGTRPASLRALWGLKHTTNPRRAKPFVAPFGTSGMYMRGECCTDPGADPKAVYRSRADNNVYAPHEYPQNWGIVDMEESL